MDLKKLYRNMREKLSSVDLPSNGRKIAPFALALVILVSFSTVLGDQKVRESYLLDNTTQLNFIEDNNIGKIIVRNQEPHPVIHSTAKFKACIYTSEDKPPVILETERDKSIYLEENSVKSIELNITIPEEKLSREGFDQILKVERREKCPVRSSPKLILKKEQN